jgi:hypothetical protein
MSHSINVAVLNFPTDVVIKKLSRKWEKNFSIYIELFIVDWNERGEELLKIGKSFIIIFWKMFFFLNKP